MIIFVVWYKKLYGSFYRYDKLVLNSIFTFFFRSSSVGKKGFRKTLDWVAQVVRLFDIRKDGTQLAVVQFGEGIRTEYSFKDQQVPF